MVKRSDIEQFYEDVKGLGLRFPVAEIARETGHSKANVSKYLSNKLEPSESFLKAFYDKFQITGKNVSRETTLQPQTNYEALLSVIVSELAALKASIGGGNAAVELKKIYKAAEDLKMLNG